MEAESQAYGPSRTVFGGFPKLGVPFWGVPLIRSIVYWGLYWGPLILGNYRILFGGTIVPDAE